MNELIYKDTTPKEVKKLREERPSNGPTPATTAAAYVQNWRSGRLLTARCGTLPIKAQLLHP
jgi:hypothetical protein